ncbi:MAG: enoyl-CoA hydratase/isomerase family protein [Anaerolineae bacterium]
MDYKDLLVQDEGGVRMIMLNRPARRNALNEQLRDELEACLNEAASDEAIRVVVLTGGEQVFSAGFDLAEVAATEFGTFEHRAREFNTAVFAFPKPLLTAVSGPALAGGFDLALAGDVILVSETAVFGHPEVSFGVPALLSPLWRRVGVSRALAFSLTGKTVTAQEALALGLVDRVVPVTDLLAEAQKVAAQIAALPSLQLRLMKEAADVVPSLGLLPGIEYELGLAQTAVQDGAALARLKAYLEQKGIGR